MVPFEGEEPMQAAAGTEAAIQFDFAENIIFEDCEMLHTEMCIRDSRRICVIRNYTPG